MNIDEIKRLLNRRGKVEFRLYGMNYTILKTTIGYVIYANIYKNRPIYFNDIDSLLENYTIFNENLIRCQNDLKNIR